MKKLLVNQHIRAVQDMKKCLMVMAIVFIFWLLEEDMSITEALISYLISIPFSYLLIIVSRSIVAWSFRAIRKRSDYPRFITRAHNSRKR